MSFGDFFAGLGHGVMGMFGMGSLWSPMAKYQQELGQAQQELSTTLQQGTLAVMSKQTAWDTQMMGLVSNLSDFIAEELKYTSSIASFASSENQTGLLILGAVLLIVITYLILQKK